MSNDNQKSTLVKGVWEVVLGAAQSVLISEVRTTERAVVVCTYFPNTVVKVPSKG
jgi:hypothetical protein